jgi:hypothetical protein
VPLNFILGLCHSNALLKRNFKHALTHVCVNMPIHDDYACDYDDAYDSDDDYDHSDNYDIVLIVMM